MFGNIILGSRTAWNGLLLQVRAACQRGSGSPLQAKIHLEIDAVKQYRVRGFYFLEHVERDDPPLPTPGN